VARIGILGGTFDPPHNGHIAIARSALAGLNLQKVIFIPAKIQPLKIDTAVSSVQDRLAMLKLALSGYDQFEISEIELCRYGMSYTVDTLRQLRGTYQNDILYLIMGADNVNLLEKWHDADELLNLCSIAAANRPGYKLSGRFKDKIVYFEMQPEDISSTEIRTRVRNGKNITGLIPTAVEEYLITHKLYLENE
jgi:nicotinate-nucleotide adenylyltransferase